MREAALLTAVAAAFAFGYFLMTRLDRFFEENRQAQEREAQEENLPDPPADGTEHITEHLQGRLSAARQALRRKREVEKTAAECYNKER